VGYLLIYVMLIYLWSFNLIFNCDLFINICTYSLIYLWNFNLIFNCDLIINVHAFIS
jgi:hypothetical protein